MKEKSKILLIDIETFPDVAYVWGKYEQDVIAFQQDWYMLSFAYKWLGEKETHVWALPDFKTYKKNPIDDKELCKKLWDLLDEAEIVIAHNGIQFDIKKSNVRFLTNGMKPPTPYKVVDTKIEAKRYFKFDSNRLDDLGQYLDLGRKMMTGGFDLWLGCGNNNKEAWKHMKEYNKKDVELLEKIYIKLLPWMETHPNMNLINGNNNGCPNCGSKDLHKRGFATTRVAKFQRWQCQKCGAWSRSPLKGGIVR